MGEPDTLAERLLAEADFWILQPSGTDIEALCREAASVVSARVQKSAPDAEFSAWVLERGNSPVSEPAYWAAGQIDPNRSSAWTGNHMAAIRFARQEDAQAVADRFMKKAGVNVRVCEHIWAQP